VVAGAVLMLTGCGDALPPQPVPSPAPTFAPIGRVTCSESDYAARAPETGWKHPQQSYYAPGQPAPSEADLQHLLINDAAVVVRYRADAPRVRREALRDWAAVQTPAVALPAGSPTAPQVEAFTSERHLTCDGVDDGQLTVFAERRGAAAPPHDDTG
jgi:hypothetical protein